MNNVLEGSLFVSPNKKFDEIQSIIRQFSAEYGFEKDYPSFEAFSKAIADYIDYYNNSRIQAKTKWMPPSKFREASMMKS